jgi:hypothetical protein
MLGMSWGERSFLCKNDNGLIAQLPSLTTKLTGRILLSAIQQRYYEERNRKQTEKHRHDTPAQ